MTGLELFQIMRQVVESVVPELAGNVILADQSATAPEGDYCTIQPNAGSSERGQANIYKSNSDPVTSPIGEVVNSVWDVRAQEVREVSIQFYGRASVTGTNTGKLSAHDYARRLKQPAKRPSIHALLFRNGIGWRNSSAVQNLDGLQESQYESRAQITAYLWIEASSSPDTNNAIYSVEVTAQNEAGDTLTTVNIEDTPE